MTRSNITFIRYVCIAKQRQAEFNVVVERIKYNRITINCKHAIGTHHFNDTYANVKIHKLMIVDPNNAEHELRGDAHQHGHRAPETRVRLSNPRRAERFRKTTTSIGPPSVDTTENQNENFYLLFLGRIRADPRVWFFCA